MNTLDLSLPGEPSAEQRRSFPRVPGSGPLLASLFGIVVLADFCFWRETPRLSVGVFGLGAALIILLNRRPVRWSPQLGALAVLLCGAAVASAIDLSFSNVLVMLALLIALAGESFYQPLRHGWSRCSEQLWTMMKTPLRWIQLLAWIAKDARRVTPSSSAVQKIFRVLWMTIPGLAVTCIFALILSDGNVLFQKFTETFTEAIRDWIASFDINFWRVILWGFTAWVTLPLLWPSPSPRSERIWALDLARLPAFTAEKTARIQSAVTLGLLNALFCCVNTIDAVYLWAHQQLPKDVGYSAFVHNGVSSLIIAVIFSAVLLVGLVQQAEAVAKWTPLRVLALLWIAQDLILLASVFLRVKLYVEAFDLTIARVNLVLFLALVATGFVLLGIHVWCQRSLGRLIQANLIASFALLYIGQFLDVNTFVANYNVHLWIQANAARNLDLPYLKSLGPPAYNALQEVVKFADGGTPHDALDYLKNEQRQAQNNLSKIPWPCWQLRDMACQRKLLTAELQ